MTTLTLSTKNDAATNLLVKALADAAVPLRIAPARGAAGEWVPAEPFLDVHITGWDDPFTLRAWAIDEDEMALFRVSIPLAEIAAVEVLPRA